MYGLNLFIILAILHNSDGRREVKGKNRYYLQQIKLVGNQPRKQRARGPPVPQLQTLKTQLQDFLGRRVCLLQLLLSCLGMFMSFERNGLSLSASLSFSVSVSLFQPFDRNGSLSVSLPLPLCLSAFFPQSLSLSLSPLSLSYPLSLRLCRSHMLSVSQPLSSLSLSYPLSLRLCRSHMLSVSQPLCPLLSFSVSSC